MKEKIKLLANNKHIFVILIILLILLIGTAGTYAWFTWSNTENTTLTMTVGNLDISFDTGNDINITTLSPVFYATDGEKTSFSIYKNNSSLEDVIYAITLDVDTISDELKSIEFKWVLTLKDSDTIITSGSFIDASSGNTMTLYSKVLEDSSISYDLYIYIDGNSNNSDSMMNKTLSGSLNIVVKDDTFATYITDLYTNAEKAVVMATSQDSDGNAITIDYNYATSVSLMNDRLGGTTSDYDGGNIRYYGANPNNYVYFNCSDYSNQTQETCELWRIIGVFNGKVKIIRNSMIGSFAWDQDKNIDSSLTTYDNDWSTSSLQVLLNEKYYNGDTSGTVTYYSESVGDTETVLNMSSIGIKNNTTRNLISTETYYLRGYNNSGIIYSDSMYNYERITGEVYNASSPTIWVGKIALAYSSDYGYAADFNYCTVNLINYNDSTCTNNNWMKSIYESNTWLLTPYFIDSKYAFVINSLGSLNRSPVFNTFGQVPVLYLNLVADIDRNIGDGTITNPYRLLV